MPSSRNPRGNISGKEFKDSVHHELISGFGRTRGSRISQVLESHLDKDPGSSFRGISAREADEALKRMEKNSYDGIDRHDIEKLRGILDKHL